MIQINLLPESMRKSESTPLPRLLATYIGVALVAGLISFYLHYRFVVARGLERKLAQLEKEVKDAQERGKVLDELLASIEVAQQHIDVVKGLYCERPVWAKILWDIKKIINHDESQNRSNPELRYLWLTSLKIGRPGKDGERAIKLDGYASALDTVTGAQMVKDLHSTMKTFRVTEPPERAVREELQRRLKTLRMERQKLKQEEAEESALAAKDAEIKDLEKSLAEAPKKESGLIAVRPFAEFFVPQSIQMGSLSWIEGEKKKKETAEALPLGKYKFSFDLLFPPPPASPESGEPKKKK